jgi:hypothetical protein
MLVSPTKLTQAREVEDAMVLVSAHEDVEGLVQRVILLEGEHVEVHWAQEVVEEKFYSLSNTSVDGAWWLVVSEIEHREQLEELSLL